MVRRLHCAYYPKASDAAKKTVNTRQTKRLVPDALLAEVELLEAQTPEAPRGNRRSCLQESLADQLIDAQTAAINKIPSVPPKRASSQLCGA